MVLNYHIPSDVLANDKVTQRKIEVSIPKKPRNRLKTAAQFCVLLAANIIVLILVYNIWTSEQKDRSILDYLKPVWRHLTANTGTVTAISYNAKEPLAIVYGKIVHVGDEVKGCKVVKIYPRAVELQNNGKIIVEKLY